jgi:hypothetical protein
MKDRTLKKWIKDVWEWITEVSKIRVRVDGSAKDGTRNILISIQILLAKDQMLA